ncbi:PadR family transcriptional regulator [Anaeromyxobacter paludicola]|uniref:Transcription regulator PadR N-terminal domain-containing protein n=1 Tax=Anaeromyxobacter paludicola TaxID=2918171 RepID=A0ABN6NAW8_9BACT|nr:PadR family transcriptional regulator [Anaeromyxobacter paludicola]BDG10361.1 hypothetical protein AMPC_34740 [Anaeromyxobacter paludicola]
MHFGHRFHHAMEQGLAEAGFGPWACGPRGFGGHRHGHHGHGRPFGFGRGGDPGDFGFRAGRKLSSSDLQLLLLALIGEAPRHGYELIKAVEERSGGFYTPSPGVIYPALTYLEEAGLAASEAEGARKRYRLTEEGAKDLAARRTEADALLAQLARIGERMARVRDAFADEVEGDARGAPERAELHDAVHALREAVRSRRGAAVEELRRVIGILREAAQKIAKG